MPLSPNRALIIRFSSVGDIVLSSLLVRTLRARFPSCRIDYIVKEEFADLVRHSPYISRVIQFPRNGTFGDLKRLRRHIGEASYDMILDIHDSLRSRYLCAGAKNVRRIRKRKLARFLLIRFKLNLYERFGGAPSVALRYLETVRSLGVEDDGQGLDLFFSDDDALQVEQLIQKKGFGHNERFIGLCPAARHNNKMWLKERFAEAAAELYRHHGYPILLFGSRDEQQRCSEVADTVMRCEPGARVCNLAGQLTLAETAAAMDRCAVVITNDSGLMHIAAARKRNVVAIFGPTVKELGFFPFGTRSIVVEHDALACRPCTHIGLPDCPRGHFKCMEEIPSQRVVAAAHKLLSSIDS